MRLIATADLPNGIKKGGRFSVPDYQGLLLLKAKVVRHEDEPVAVTVPVAEDAAVTPPTTTTRRTTTYRRRDLTAEGSDTE